MAVYPAVFVGLGIIVYAIAYFVYGKWYDKTAWEPDPKKPTPAHVYMDGIEFFPANKYVLYGFQFKGIAGLGPILGPFVALAYGWIPALIWILLGNFFIGWLHDYSAIMLTVRNEGKTMGPLTYEYISPRARNALLGFLLFYLILITAVFVFLCGVFFNTYPSSVLGTFFVVLAGVISGVLVYKAKVPLMYATIIGLIITAVGIWIGILVPVQYQNLTFWMFVTCVYCFIGAVTPMLWYTQPVVFMASFPCIFGILLIIIGALASPVTGVTIAQAGFKTLYDPAVGPLWPILTVSIACGAISGWHSLVGTSGTGRQLDVETDALPVGAGSMLTEGLLALAALAAYMVLTAEEVSAVKWVSLVTGAGKMLAPLLGGEAALPVLTAFFAIWLELFAITIQMLVTRFFRLALAETVAPVPPLRVLIGNKYVASAIGLAIGFAFAYTGAWINLWLLFGGSNQLLAGLALLLATVYLAREKRIKGPTLGPGIFMVVTCEAALLWEVYIFFRAVMKGTPIAKGTLANYPGIALAFNAIFGIVGIILFILGLIVVMDWYKSYKAVE
jgi:carbon starvation protein